MMNGGAPNERTPIITPMLAAALQKEHKSIRSVWNSIPIVFNILCPWAVFVWTTTCLVGRLRHEHLGYSIVLTFVALIPTFTYGYFSHQAWVERDPNPLWFKFGSITSTIAYVLAFCAGFAIFHSYLFPYFLLEDMKFYMDLDVTNKQGKNMMDAGRIEFIPGTHLDLGRSWHYTYGNVYCVVPIVGPSGKPANDIYDFWAVGLNCCATTSADFRCQEYNNARVHSGLRSLDWFSEPFYEKAILQAESIHNITAKHPLFFQWTEDPFFVMDTWRQEGWRAYLAVVLSYLIICIFSTLLALCMFARYHKRKAEEADEIPGVMIMA